MAVAKLIGRELTLEDLVGDLMTVESILLKLKSYPEEVRGVAIDAPLIIKNETGQRRCETLLSRMYGSRRASCHTSNLALYPDPDSVHLSVNLEGEGFRHLGATSEKWQIECYPHPALIELFDLVERHQYKKGKVGDRKRGQVALALLLQRLADSKILRLKVPGELAKPFDKLHIAGLSGLALKRNEDLLDAVICVYVAGLYALDTTARVFGDTTEGYIFVPTEVCI